MRKALILLAFGLFMSDVASAEKIDKGEAYRIASEFFGGGAGRRMAPAAFLFPLICSCAIYSYQKATKFTFSQNKL